jgi:hypothetical protein
MEVKRLNSRGYWAGLFKIYQQALKFIAACGGYEAALCKILCSIVKDPRLQCRMHRGKHLADCERHYSAPWRIY